MSRVENLKNEAKTILRNIKSGSHSKRSYREKVVFNSIYALACQGDVPISWHAMRDKHIYKLVSYWKDKKLSDKSIRLYLIEIRFFLHTIDVKVSRTNDDFNLKRNFATQKNEFTMEKLNLLNDPIVKCIFKLQIYFGLTLSEAFRFNPTIYYRNDHLMLTRETTTNSKDRMINIVTQFQKDTISEIESLLPFNSSFISQYGYHSVRERYKLLVTQCGLTSRVSYRDVFARARHERLIKSMNEQAAKNIITEEMGISKITLWKYLNEQK